jgi:hypothetical protein
MGYTMRCSKCQKRLYDTTHCSNCDPDRSCPRCGDYSQDGGLCGVCQCRDSGEYNAYLDEPDNRR